MAFNDAITDLHSGRIDYAVVGGASGIFRPQSSIAYQRLHMLFPDVSTPYLTSSWSDFYVTSNFAVCPESG